MTEFVYLHDPKFTVMLSGNRGVMASPFYFHEECIFPLGITTSSEDQSGRSNKALGSSRTGDDMANNGF